MALPAQERLLSVPFLKVALTALLYFVSFGTTLAVLARYAKDELARGPRSWVWWWAPWPSRRCWPAR